MRRTSDGVWGRFDHGQPSVGVTGWAVIIGASVLLFAVMGVSSWRARRQKAQFLHDSKSRMFRELADAHQLDRTSRRLLKRLALGMELPSASLLFVEPKYFESEGLPDGLKPQTTELQQVRHVLYG